MFFSHCFELVDWTHESWAEFYALWERKFKMLMKAWAFLKLALLGVRIKQTAVKLFDDTDWKYYRVNLILINSVIWCENSLYAWKSFAVKTKKIWGTIFPYSFVSTHFYDQKRGKSFKGRIISKIGYLEWNPVKTYLSNLINKHYGGKKKTEKVCLWK